MKRIQGRFGEHRLATLVCGIILSTAQFGFAQSYAPGDIVSVIHSGEFRVGSEVVGNSTFGEIYEVGRVEGNWLWIESEQGYLHRTDVAPYDDSQQNTSGTLDPRDVQTVHGNYVDSHEIDLQAGELVVIDLRSDDFDTFLSVHCLQDVSVHLENDDFDGNLYHSQISFEAPITATYSISASSYAAGVTGDYELTINTQSGGGSTPAPSQPIVQETGTLEEGDLELYAGEFVDTFTFQAQEGERAQITLTSQEFDTFLILTLPDGERILNDDFDGSRGISRLLDLELLQTGTYEVQVTSYAVGEVGNYELVIELASQSNRPGGMLATGDRIQGELIDETVTVDDLSADIYQFEAMAGTRLLSHMTSTEFDTFIRLVHPNGSMQDFDDTASDGTTNSSIDMVLTESGVYQLYASAYSGEGSYLLKFDTVDDRPAGQRILALFVGIADYPGEDSDLPLSDSDAELLYQVMQTQFGMHPDDAVLLTDEDATVDNVMASLDDLGSRASPEDLLLFIYLGHGGQQDGAADAEDPDGVHETLYLYDGSILDDDFAASFNASSAGTALVLLDSCFSGGFAKDVVSAPGRMGIFSSEEDVYSLVPRGDFEASGYLSQFFTDGISADRAISDTNGDNQLTAFELSHYLGERYRNDVRSDLQKSGDAIDPSENLSYQRLVIDRGGISSGTVIFTWE